MKTILVTMSVLFLVYAAVQETLMAPDADLLNARSDPLSESIKFSANVTALSGMTDAITVTVLPNASLE